MSYINCMSETNFALHNDIRIVNPTYDFTGQVALVTGGSSGMGFATARAFAEAGATWSSQTSTSPRLVRPQRS